MLQCHSLKASVLGDSHLPATSGTSAFKMCLAAPWQPPRKGAFPWTEAPVVTFSLAPSVKWLPPFPKLATLLRAAFQRTCRRAADPDPRQAILGEGRTFHIKIISTLSTVLSPQGTLSWAAWFLPGVVTIFSQVQQSGRSRFCVAQLLQRPAASGRYRITQSSRLAKTSKITMPNRHPNTPVPAKLCPQVPRPRGFWTPPGMGTPPLPWAAWSSAW